MGKVVRYCSVFYKDELVGAKVKVADNFLLRFRGLIGVKDWKNLDGLLLLPCNAIHTFFMSLTIDALFLDKNFTIIYMTTISPWKLPIIVTNATSVLELPQGTIQKFRLKLKHKLTINIQR